jgi:UDP-N-acetylmuramyl pentapeptide phosphotransferase/UDP-N-acetylglucosamine-1-phosphate transferase
MKTFRALMSSMLILFVVMFLGFALLEGLINQGHLDHRLATPHSQVSVQMASKVPNVIGTPMQQLGDMLMFFIPIFVIVFCLAERVSLSRWFGFFGQYSQETKKIEWLKEFQFFFGMVFVSEFLVAIVASTMMQGNDLSSGSHFLAAMVALCLIAACATFDGACRRRGISK